MGEANPQRNRSSWEQLHRIIQLQFPHSKVYGLRIREGAAVSYERIEFTCLLTREMALEERTVPESFSESWLRLIRFCRQSQDTMLAEVHFRDGSPQHFLMERPGDTFEDASAANKGNLMTQRAATTA